jgi:hypothetical protein
MENSYNFQDIHEATDGKLRDYAIITRYSVSEKINMFGSLVNLIKSTNSKLKLYGIHGINMITSDIQKTANYQSIDKMYADDVLAEICNLLMQEENREIVETSIDILCEQMFDMFTTNGSCQSGRVNRLFQVYVFLREK